MTTANDRRITELATVVTELISRPSGSNTATLTNTQHLNRSNDFANINSAVNVTQPQSASNNSELVEIRSLLEKFSTRLDKLEQAVLESKQPTAAAEK